MNYFQIFEIPVQLQVDKHTIRQKYLSLSRQYHPDYFINSSAAAQGEALDKSAQLNKAFKTFNNKDETIQYVLSLKGLLAEGEKYNLPPPFLMEMMELNEAVAEAQLAGDAADPTVILQKIQQTENEIYEGVKDIIEYYKEGVTTEKELLQVKDYYFKKKYIQRLKQQLSEML